MKRQSDKQLSKSDWEKGDSPERHSEDALASEKTMKERILKRAKLSGSTLTDSESPLKLFSQGLLTGKVSAIKDTAIKMIASSKPISSLTEEHSQDSAGSQDTSTKHSQANSVCSDDVSIPDYLDNIFSRNISRLNTAVSKWIASQVVKNPICDLTPIFGDYQRYFKEFSREAHLSPASASPTNNHSDTPYRPTQGVTTITPTLESTEISSASAQPLRGLLFSKPSTQVHSFSSPSSQTSKLTFSSTVSEPRPIRFNPFTKPTISKPTDHPVPPSSLSRTFDPPQLKTGSVIDALKLATTLSSKKDVLSGQEAPTPVTSSSSSSTSTSLIWPPTVPLSLSIPGVKHLSTTSTSTTFKFNTIPLPIFPSAPSLSDLSTSNSAPFPAIVNKPISPAVADGDDGEDDNTEQDKPTTPPALKLDTEHTVFSCNSKIFTKREASFVDIGICILRVRKNPDTEKTQLLVRNSTAFARIIINTIITETTPLSKPRDKEVMIICPKQETETESPQEGNQNPEMDTFLIRVKTIEFAATLFSLLDEAKRKRMIKTA